MDLLPAHISEYITSLGYVNCWVPQQSARFGTRVRTKEESQAALVRLELHLDADLQKRVLNDQARVLGQKVAIVPTKGGIHTHGCRVASRFAWETFGSKIKGEVTHSVAFYTKP